MSATLQEALVATLLADTAVAGWVGTRVRDWPGPDATFPLVTVGDIQELAWDVGAQEGTEAVVTVHTWARGASSRVTARAIGRALRTCLHRQPGKLSITGFKVVAVTFVSGSVEREADTETSVSHGVYRFRVLMHAA